MSFWNSETVTAKKEHGCLYCGRKIMPREKYSRECGIYCGEFQHYCLCERCRYLCDEYEHDDHLGDFLTTLTENDLVTCPACGSINFCEEEIVNYCQREGVPVFLKSSLAGIWGTPLIQEYPEQLQKNIHSGS